MEGILSVAREFGLKVIEDATEALGSTYQETHMGTFGLFGVLMQKRKSTSQVTEWNSYYFQFQFQSIWFLRVFIRDPI